MGLTIKTGKAIGIALTSNVTINTGLTSITEFVVYITTVTKSGLIVCHYNKNLGETSRSIICSSVYSGNIGGGINLNAKPVVNGGNITISGTDTAYSNTLNLAPDVEYTWIAYGEE